jgi:hypothetical protein
VPEEAVLAFSEQLSTIMEEYESKNVFNCDETGLYWKSLPERTIESHHLKATGRKALKERVTVLLSVNMCGKKLPLLIIGKFGNPRCFCKHNKNMFPCEYTHSKNAWMTRAIFNNWLSTLNRRMIIQQRKILLFLDNATPHKAETEYSNVRLIFLPPNTTSVAQPVDQGIVWSFKCKYRKLLLEYVISGFESKLQCQVAEKMDILQSMWLMKKAWDEVHSDVIINAFRQAKFITDAPQELPEEVPCNLIPDFQRYVTIDDQLFSEELENIDLDSNEVCSIHY